MKLCHSHNLNRDPTRPKPYGIRVSLPPGDSFNRLLGPEWERFHWFISEAERDAALTDMAGEHLYSRRGDRPHVNYLAVDSVKESDSS